MTSACFFMSAPFVGLVGCTSIVQRERVGTHSKDLFAVHGSKSPFFVLV